MRIPKGSPLHKIPAHRRRRAYRLAVPKGGRRVLERNFRQQVRGEPEFKGKSGQEVEAEVHKRLVKTVQYYDRNKFSAES